MTAWLLIAAVAVTLILWRAIGVAGAIWRERAHVTAHCAADGRGRRKWRHALRATPGRNHPARHAEPAAQAGTA